MKTAAPGGDDDDDDDPVCLAIAPEDRRWESSSFCKSVFDNVLLLGVVK